MENQRVATVGLLLCSSILAACSVEERGGGALEEAAAVVAVKNPLSAVEPPGPADRELRGTIVEVLRAGPYTYAAVASPDGSARWVVTMRGGLSRGDEVEVKNMGTRRGFASKRLGRTFEEVIFGVVRTVSPTGREG